MSSLKAAAIGAAVASFVCLSAVALAGSGIGGVFNLGQTNSVNAKSTLTGNTAGSELSVGNTSTNPAATALNLSVPAGLPPLKVSSNAKVTNLNADRIDGLDSSSFLPKAGTAADSSKLGGHLPGDFMPATLAALNGKPCTVGTTGGRSELTFGSNQTNDSWNALQFYCLTPDFFEPDDTSGTAHALPGTPGIDQALTEPATIYPAGDNDWYTETCLTVNGDAQCSYAFLGVPGSAANHRACAFTGSYTLLDTCSVAVDPGQMFTAHVYSTDPTEISRYRITVTR